MPIFNLKELEPILRTMVYRYDCNTHKSTVKYFDQMVFVSYTPKEFNKVFGVPYKGYFTMKPFSKMSSKDKVLLVKLSCKAELLE